MSVASSRVYRERDTNAAFIDALRCWLGLAPFTEEAAAGRARDANARGHVSPHQRQVLAAAVAAERAGQHIRPTRDMQKQSLLLCVRRGWLRALDRQDTRAGYELTAAGHAAAEASR